MPGFAIKAAALPLATLAVPELPLPLDPVFEVPKAVDRFWLMSISCSRLFTCTS
jgi:hypothetical protein